jgi:hypothetical protein
LTEVTRWAIKLIVSPVASPICLRQHGTFYPFSQKNSQCEFFCEKDRVSSALLEPALSVVEWGDIPHQTRERLLHGSIGRFAGFAHVVLFVVQTSTA